MASLLIPGMYVMYYVLCHGSGCTSFQACLYVFCFVHGQCFTSYPVHSTKTHARSRGLLRMIYPKSLYIRETQRQEVAAAGSESVQDPQNHVAALSSDMNCPDAVYLIYHQADLDKPASRSPACWGAATQQICQTAVDTANRSWP